LPAFRWNRLINVGRHRSPKVIPEQEHWRQKIFHPNSPTSREKKLGSGDIKNLMDACPAGGNRRFIMGQTSASATHRRPAWPGKRDRPCGG
jgi:hypothetical protein